MKKAYKYGIELETVMDRDRFEAIKHDIQEDNLPYSFKGDGSISCNDRNETGVEIVASHPLGYTELERSVKALSRILIANEVKVNTSTGFHVHMSNKRFFNSRNLKHLVFTWCAIEDVLLSTQPRSRYNNTYCQRLLTRFVKTYGEKDLPRAKSEMIRVLGGVRRYYTLNLNAMALHGTIEARMHSGTIDSNKILAWVELLEAIYTYSLTKYNHEEVLALFNTKISDEKIATVFKMLGLSEKLDRHFSRRIQRFGFDYLARQQECAWEAIKIAPTVQKLNKRYMEISRNLDASRNQLDRASSYLNATL